MKIHSKELSKITEEVNKTLKQTNRIANLKCNCHFSHMGGNIFCDFNFANNGVFDPKTDKRMVIHLLKEINEYFAALGTNEK